MKLKVLIHAESEGEFSVSAPALPGCHSQGDTLDESLANIREAADLWLEGAARRATHDAQAMAPDARRQELDW